MVRARVNNQLLVATRINNVSPTSLILLNPPKAPNFPIQPLLGKLFSQPNFQLDWKKNGDFLTKIVLHLVFQEKVAVTAKITSLLNKMQLSNQILWRWLICDMFRLTYFRLNLQWANLWAILSPTFQTGQTERLVIFVNRDTPTAPLGLLSHLTLASPLFQHPCLILTPFWTTITSRLFPWQPHCSQILNLDT